MMTMTLTAKLRQQAIDLRKIRLSQRRITSEQALEQCLRVARHAESYSKVKSGFFDLGRKKLATS